MEQTRTSAVTLDSFVSKYLTEVCSIAGLLDQDAIEELAGRIVQVREAGGRIFFLGVGGGAANASHAVNDFRKIAGIECYAPSDSVAEITARINDEGWTGCYAAWLTGSRIERRDAVFVFSVGGGDEERGVSENLVEAIRTARSAGARVLGVVGRDGGYTARTADACVVVPTVSLEGVTPHTEEFQAVLLHLLVSHPLIKKRQTHWESLRG